MAKGATYHLSCDSCGHAVTTAGPARRADGRLVARLYCPTCGEVRECAVGAEEQRPRAPLGVPIGPRHGPAGRLAAALAGRLRREGAPLDATCPDCGGTDLLLAPEPGREPPCPRCERGRLRQRRE